MVGNPMHAEVSADAGDYISSLQAAIGRTDELGDESAQAARRVDRLGEDASGTSFRLNSFSASAMGATTATAALSTATTVSLIPALGTLSTTLVPLTAALGGVATAATGVATGFGAVIGTGLFAYGEQLADQNEDRLAQIDEKIAALEAEREATGGLTDAQQAQLESLREQREEVKETTSIMGALSQEMDPVKEQLRETALNLGEDFIPLIRDAIDALPEFIRRIEASIGPLEPFANALRDAGQVAMDVIPQMVEVLMDMGRDALPAVRDLGRFLADNAIPTMEAMGDTLGRVADILPDIGGTLVDILPKLNEFGLRVMENVVPALGDASGRVMDLVDGFNDLDERTQNIAIGSALGGPAVLGILSKLTTIHPLLGLIGGGVATLGAAWMTNFGDIQGKTEEFVDDAQPMIEDTQEVLKGLGESAVDAGEEVVDEFTPAAESITDAFADVRRQDWGAAFGDLERAAGQSSDAIRRLYVGEGGSGGLTATFRTATTNAQDWLQGEGGEVLKAGIMSLGSAAFEVAEDFQGILVGPDGKSGVLTEMVDQATVFLEETAPDLFGDAMQAIGKGIRQGLIDLTNPLRGKDSELWDMFIDSNKWLLRNIPRLMEAAGKAIVNGIISGFQGLVQGLVGAEEGEIWMALQNVETKLTNNMADLVGGVPTSIVNTISGGLNYLTGEGRNTLLGDLRSVFSSISDIPANFLADSWNAIIPAEVGIDPVTLPEIKIDAGPLGSATVGGQTIFDDFTFDLPQLQTGGFVAEDTPAMLHGGERVLPETQVSDRGEASFDPDSVAEGFDRSTLADEMARKLDRIDRAIRDDGTVRVSERDVLHALGRLADRHGIEL